MAPQVRKVLPALLALKVLPVLTAQLALKATQV
jgi:hypothetical protein